MLVERKTYHLTPYNPGKILLLLRFYCTLEVNLEQVEGQQVVNVGWLDRWTVYQRLQELEIPCFCTTNQPLTVEISNPMALVQLWSVIRHVSASRQEMVAVLEKCWCCDF